MRGWSRFGLWVVLLSPLALWSYRYQSGESFYGEYLHWTGDWSVWLILLVLVITPLRRWLPTAHWLHWLLRQRRDLGIAAALYALAHGVAYLLNKADLTLIVQDSLSMSMLTGWVALIVLLLLALTSNDRSLRRLGPRWKVLHRSVYAAALLAIVHWQLTAFDPTVALLHLGALLLLLLLRLPLRTLFSRSS